jgi:hypothetical protein
MTMLRSVVDGSQSVQIDTLRIENCLIKKGRIWRGETLGNIKTLLFVEYNDNATRFI